MSIRTVSHDRGDSIEVVSYRDGVEVSRTTKAKKGLKLGDAVESFLTSYGITKEWYVKFKSEHGLPPSCECDARQEWLNRTADAHPTIAHFGVKLLDALKRKPA